MATGNKYPGPVTFDDNNPSTQFCKLFLTVPGLKVGGLMSKKAKNGDIKQQLEPGSIHIEIKVTTKSGEKTYVYEKSLPEDIDPKQSKVQPQKDDQVVVKLCKATEEPWTAHSKHFVLP